MLVSLKSRLNGSLQIPCLLLLLLLSAPVAFGQAQSNAADLQGTVRDATGAVVANAGVTARNPGTNFSRSAAPANTSAAASSALPALPSIRLRSV